MPARMSTQTRHRLAGIPLRSLAKRGPSVRQQGGVEPAGHGSYRRIRAPPPRTSRSTSASVAIEVSPGVVIASAPCAAPYSTAVCRSLAVQEPVDQAGGEAVAAADAVEDLQVAAGASPGETRAVDQAIAPQSLTVAVCTVRSVVGDDLEVRVGWRRPRSIIAAKLSSSRSDEVLVDALDLEAEAGGEVLLVADHHVDVRAIAAVDLLRLRRARRRPSTGSAGS